MSWAAVHFLSYIIAILAYTPELISVLNVTNDLLNIIDWIFTYMLPRKTLLIGL